MEATAGEGPSHAQAVKRDRRPWDQVAPFQISQRVRLRAPPLARIEVTAFGAQVYKMELRYRDQHRLELFKEVDQQPRLDCCLLTELQPLWLRCIETPWGAALVVSHRNNKVIAAGCQMVRLRARVAWVPVLS